MRVNKQSFTELLKSGRVARSALVNIRFLQHRTRQTGVNEYSFVVSSKVSRLAVVRNLIKRRGRAIINKRKKEIVGALTCAFFFFRPEVVKLSYNELELVIMTILKQANLLNK